MQIIWRVLIALGIVILIVLFLANPKHEMGTGENGNELFKPTGVSMLYGTMARQKSPPMMLIA